MPKVKRALVQASRSAAAAAAFVKLWDDLQLIMHTHMVHEDDVLFPAGNEWIPHHADPFEEVLLATADMK